MSEMVKLIAYYPSLMIGNDELRNEGNSISNLYTRMTEAFEHFSQVYESLWC